MDEYGRVRGGSLVLLAVLGMFALAEIDDRGAAAPTAAFADSGPRVSQAPTTPAADRVVPSAAEPPTAAAPPTEPPRRRPGPVSLATTTVTTSRYVSFLTGDAGRDTGRAFGLGCSHTGPAGVVVLGVGRQRDGGAQAFGPRGTVKSDSFLADIAAAYAGGLSACAGPGWTVALTTSNFEADDVAQSSKFGHDWAAFVELAADRVYDAVGEAVTVAAGIDLEPGWGSMAAASAWFDAYVARTDTPLVIVPSADGCAFDTPRNCSGDWTSAGLARFAWGYSDAVYVMPQIFDRTGKMAQQWAQIARAGLQAGLTPRFLGVLTQHRACAQNPNNRNCRVTDNDSATARRQLVDALAVYPELSGVAVGGMSDIGWESVNP